MPSISADAASCSSPSPAWIIRQVTLGDYLKVLGYLGRVPGWGTQGLRFQFYESMQTLSDIEPLSLLFIQDQLRGSPLLFYSQVIDSLQRDANKLAGVHHKLFGKEVGVGFRALNPGLARGTLHARPDLRHLDAFAADGIYLLPETVSELPPVAGIMTAGEGNPLSHVQLLARNLGIPNVGVDENLLSAIQEHDGEAVVLAVSPAGLVELSRDGANWNTVFGETESSQDVVIRPDLEKLDLSVKDFINLDDLRANDSGRTVGPKAAKLGELRKQFPRGRVTRRCHSLWCVSRGGAGPALSSVDANGVRVDGAELPPHRTVAGRLGRTQADGRKFPRRTV